jgi:hypothetical protein
MYAEIHVKSEDNESSRGKTTWLNTGDAMPSIKILRTKPEHLGRPPWHVQLSANGYRELGSGQRGGEWRGNKYKLQVELTHAEVAALVNFALVNGLIQVVPDHQDNKNSCAATGSTANPSVKGTSRKRAAPYVER